MGGGQELHDGTGGRIYANEKKQSHGTKAGEGGTRTTRWPSTLNRLVNLHVALNVV